MNALEKDQRQGANYSQNWPAAMTAVDLRKMAKPVGTFGGPTDVILRFRNGELVAADMGDQGGGQN